MIAEAGSVVVDSVSAVVVDDVAVADVYIVDVAGVVITGVAAGVAVVVGVTAGFLSFVVVFGRSDVVSVCLLMVSS